MKRILYFCLLLFFSNAIAKEKYRDPNSFSGFGGTNKSGFEKLSCQQLVQEGTKNIAERSQKMIGDAGLNVENCKRWKVTQVVNLLASVVGSDGVESECIKKLSFIQKKIKLESEDFRRLMKIRMALYDVQYIYGMSAKANEWFSKFNCEPGLRANAFIPLAKNGRPEKPGIPADTDKDLINKLEGHCEALEPMIGSSIPTFTIVANELYGSKGLGTIAKDRAICQQVIDEFRASQIKPKRMSDANEPGKVRGEDCPPQKKDVKCQDILYSNSAVTGDVCKYSQFEYCLLGGNKDKGSGSGTGDTRNGGDLK